MGNYGIKVDVNINGLRVNDQLAPKVTDAINNAIQGSLSLIRDRWRQEVQQKLRGSKSAYLQGLGADSVVYQVTSDGFTGSIQLTEKFSILLEKGFPAFDMKLGFAKSPKAHKSNSGGWYLTIPFRHTTPNRGVLGQSMSNEIYKAARKLPAGGKLSFPGIGDKSWTGYQHKNTQYDGLTRIIKSYQHNTKSQYYTFRRVSNNSDPMSWWHPGYKGIKIAKSLMPFAQSTFIDMLTTNLNGIARR